MSVLDENVAIFKYFEEISKILKKSQRFLMDLFMKKKSQTM